MCKFWQRLRTDGQLHLLACLCVLLGAYLFVPLWCANIIAVAVAVGKEIWDAKTGKGTAEWHDIFCDMYGIIAGNLLIWLSSFVG